MADAVITSVLGQLPTVPLAGREMDVVLLTADQRARGHGRLRSNAGRSVRVSLPQGRELNDGDVLVLEEDVAVVVQAADEDVLEVEPETARQWGIAAYVMGNLHRSVRFLEEVMRTPYEPSTATALDEVGVPHRRRSCPLTGERVRAVGAHSHDD